MVFYQNVEIKTAAQIQYVYVYMMDKTFTCVAGSVFIYYKFHLSTVCMCKNCTIAVCSPISLQKPPLIRWSTPHREASVTVGLAVACDTCHQWKEQFASYSWWRNLASWGLVVYPIIYQVLYIPGGCLGFLNHQQYKHEHDILHSMKPWWIGILNSGWL